MKKTEMEVTGKVFVVVEGKRRCLICRRVFTRPAAAEHAVTICAPTSTKSDSNEYSFD